MKNNRITIETTTGTTTIEVDSICAYTHATNRIHHDYVQIHMKSGTIFETSECDEVMRRLNE